MIDLHCHILPGMDDGAESFEAALEMAAIAVHHGIRHIAATPHCITGSAREVRSNLALLQELLSEEQLPLRLYPGMEIFGTYETARLLQEGRLLTLNGSRYPLIEFDFDTDGEEETEILRSIISAGYTPLVAHPERYRCICHQPELVNLWHKMGCLFQINRGSLLGRYGHNARYMSMELVRRGFATAVATDAHSPVVRTPRAGDAYDLLSQSFSPATAELLLEQNPRRILRNQILLTSKPNWFE